MKSSDDDFLTAEELSDDIQAYSSDEAPEEESVAAGKAQVSEREKQVQEAKKEENSKLKSKRRAQNQRFSEQKQEKSRRTEQSQVEDSIPELLPENILENIEISVDEAPKKNKHITFDDDDDLGDLDDKELERQIKAARLKLANMKKDTKKVGKINVKLLKAKRSKLPPPAQAGVSTMKNKWLNRRSLGKKVRY